MVERVILAVGQEDLAAERSVACCEAGPAPVHPAFGDIKGSYDTMSNCGVHKTDSSAQNLDILAAGKSCWQCATLFLCQLSLLNFSDSEPREVDLDPTPRFS